MISRAKLMINKQGTQQFSYYPTQYFFIYYKESGKVFNFSYCREIFAGYFQSNSEYVGYIAPNLNITLINKFFNAVHRKLKLKEKTIIYKTNYKNAILFKVPKFWRESHLKREVFTLMLRCACHHYKDGDSLETGLLRYNLTAHCNIAITHFLNGHTNFWNSHFGYTGFVDFFKYKSEKTIKKYLVKL